MTDRVVRVAIVDDEPLARRGIRLRLEALGGFEIVAESGNGRDAISDIQRERPDAVFLDVQMPGLDGFDVVDAIGAGRMPVTVFVTAYDTYALKAFEAHAVDYLLKPISEPRFAAAVERVRTLIQSGSAPQRLVLRDGARALLIDPGEIDWIQSDGDYVRVYVRGRGYLVRHTLTSLEEQLNTRRFVRVHRSTIVNAASVREVVPEGDRGYRVLLRDGVSVKASRGHRDAVDRLLGNPALRRERADSSY